MEVRRIHSYAATLTGKPPQSGEKVLYSFSYEDLCKQALTWALANGAEEEDIKIYYQITIEADSRWGEVNDHTNYEELITRLTQEFRYLQRDLPTLTPEPSSDSLHAHNNEEPTIDESQLDWESDELA